MPERSYYGITLSEWQEMDWWPSGSEAQVTAGFAGHDREVVVNIDAFDHDDPVPEHFVHILKDHLPVYWYIENRGSRIELHPSGSFAGGYDSRDLLKVKLALTALGLKVTVRDDGDDAA